ncbi:cell wall-associated NlpC family hydrolase [Lipingzhangella halophila]|uniref:Cell wall-associated NlpC family hydrolase n=1 Tax=Lipingzhangella halophila TaxID=1783352 RepID=A0A7W7RLZ8_9ACTN|nr:NlpC/P60 family protein [Lipingzhangella halophila]MBB4934419.1 cell wall-associated NlpC family hydrolase [Lipingzhangella halophila]
MLKLIIGLGAAVIFIPVIISAAAIGTSAAPPAPTQVEGIDPVLLDAYTRGATYLDDAEGYDQCTGMRWSILAGIGEVESDHGATVDIDSSGDTAPPFIGPRLDGSGTGGNLTPHYDTDDGRWDDDDEYDRAVGVTQHLPANWADYGVDANDDGNADPHNVYDSVAATAVELCQSAGGDNVEFADEQDVREALYRYNPADWYVEDVMAEIEHYDSLPLEVLAEGGNKAGQQAVEWALDQRGKPYLWGGTGPDAFDCSGLTMRAWQEAGVDIPRVTTDQYQAGTRVSRDELQPGDLLFYNRGPDPQPGHVTMYVGDGQMINAPATGEVVRIDPIDMDYYASAFAGAVRPVEWPGTVLGWLGASLKRHAVERDVSGFVGSWRSLWVGWWGRVGGWPGVGG